MDHRFLVRQHRLYFRTLLPCLSKCGCWPFVLINLLHLVILIFNQIITSILYKRTRKAVRVLFLVITIKQVAIHTNFNPKQNYMLNSVVSNFQQFQCVAIRAIAWMSLEFSRSSECTAFLTSFSFNLKL